MKISLSDLINKIIIYLIKGLIFILPLFFLPWTSEWFEFNKQYLLWLVAPIILILWLIKITVKKEIKFKRTPLDIPILVFFTIYSLATIFSIDKFTSVFGESGSYAHSLLGLFSLVILYFIITNFVSEERGLFARKVIKFGSISLAIMALVIILASLGLLGDWSAQFNPLASPRLDYASSLSIASQTLGNRLILGSGPGTFSYNFSLYRSIEFNQNNNWLLRFNNSASYVIDLITMTGILGLLSYLLILSLFYYLIFILRDKIKQVKDKKIIIGLISAFSLVTALQFLYTVSTVILFLFWLLLALIMVVLREVEPSAFKEVKVDISNYLNWQRIFPVLIFIICCAWLMLAIFEVKYYIADYYFTKEYNRQDYLNRAIGLNPYKLNYQISLAKLYLNQARAESMREKSERDNELIQLSIDKSINWARQAVETRPSSVVAQETLGMIYRDVRLLTVGSEPWAVSSFEQAVKLEPTNPVLWTELGKAYLNNNQEPEAAIAFKQALDLKRDYYEAQFGLAKFYVKEKKEDQALIILDNLAETVADPEVYFEQGRLYYNLGEIDLAIESFNKALIINPNHANALYGMGLAYQLLDEKDQALEIFQRILEHNPDSEDVKQKIKELEK